MFWRIKSTPKVTPASSHQVAPRTRFWGFGREFGWLAGGPEFAGLPTLSSEIGGIPGASGNSSLEPSGLRGKTGFGPASRLDRSGPPGKGAGKASNGHAEDGNSGPENSYEAQPSDRDGVPEDMATMVLDSPALVAGSAAGSNLRPNPTPESGLNARGEVDPASDAAVMLRVAAGDEAGFNYLVGKYHRPMIHFLYRMVHNQSVAEELAQEVFLRVYRARDSYRAEARFTTWLYRIATNLAVNHARDTRHERAAQTVYLDAPDEETGATPDLADDEPTVEQRLVRDERMAAIRSHVMALPERQRMAVLMHKYQGMDYRQIGEVLKLSESATKSLLFRAYQTLRDKLKDFV
jgi:RNA polymerase sigma-70 factor, ECF subfamily